MEVVSALNWAVVVTGGVGTGFGIVAGVLLARSRLLDRRRDLKDLLLARSDCLKHIDTVAGALLRVRHERDALAEGHPRAVLLCKEEQRLDGELRTATAHFLDLSRRAERKGAAPASYAAVLARSRATLSA